MKNDLSVVFGYCQLFLKNFDGDIIRHRQLFRNGIDEKRTTKRLNSFFFFFQNIRVYFVGHG